MSIKMPANPAEPSVIFNNSVSGILSKDITGAGVAIALTDVEAQQSVTYIKGTIIANVDIVVPSETKIYYVWNDTTGAFTLTFTTAAGSGIAVAQNNKAILVCDAVNVVRFTPDFI